MLRRSVLCLFLFLPTGMVACADTKAFNRLPNLTGLTRTSDDVGAFFKAQIATVELTCKDMAVFRYTDAQLASKGIADLLVQQDLKAKDISRGTYGAMWLAGKRSDDTVVLLGNWFTDSESSNAGTLKLCLFNN